MKTPLLIRAAAWIAAAATTLVLVDSVALHALPPAAPAPQIAAAGGAVPPL